jgi:hypothetical protein
MDRTRRRSMVDTWRRQPRGPPEEVCAGVPVRGTSSWWRGEQEERTGSPTPISTRRRRGTEGQAMAKEGGG